MYDPVSKKIVISRDVVFEKQEKWNWNRTIKKDSCDVLEWGDEEKEREEDMEKVEEENGANSSD